MKTIKYEFIESENIYSVAVPYELKDSFKSVFKSAKWNSLVKEWEIGPRSKKRLENWIETVNQSEALQVVEEHDDIEMSEKEIEQLQNTLSEVQKKIESKLAELASAKDTAEKLENTKKVLSEKRGELEKIREEVAAENAKIEKQKNEIRGKVEAIIDMGLVIKCKNIMSRSMYPADRNAKARFEEARYSLRAEREKLNKAGLDSAALARLCTANVNRPDRDHPDFVNDDDLYSIFTL